MDLIRDGLAMMFFFCVLFQRVKGGIGGAALNKLQRGHGRLSGAKNAQCTSLRCLPTLGQDGQLTRITVSYELKRRAALKCRFVAMCVFL